MKVTQSVHKLPEESARFLLWQSPPFTHIAQKFSTTAELDDKVDVLGVLVTLQKSNNVLVLEDTLYLQQIPLYLEMRDKATNSTSSFATYLHFVDHSGLRRSFPYLRFVQLPGEVHRVIYGGVESNRKCGASLKLTILTATRSTEFCLLASYTSPNVPLPSFRPTASPFMPRNGHLN